MHEISIKFPHILPFSVSRQHCYFPPRLALRRPRPYIFPPPGAGSASLLPSVEREIQMDIVLSPGINHIRCSSGEGGRKRRGRKEGLFCREGGGRTLPEYLQSRLDFDCHAPLHLLSRVDSDRPKSRAGN